MEKELMIMTGCDRGLCKHAVGRQDRQLNTYDWLADVPGNTETTDLVEVQFKHTRKGYYHNVNNLPLKKGDIVAVEALQMKIGDVEYQGDCNKAIFYYIADERVDFRQLIKDLAATFHVRIEMKQIGARQEAGLIGGTGPCGRELCCATWMKNFVSVGTQSARYQDISLNPQKLAGMCAKLKCCLNYEVDDYVEASRQLPPKDIQLQTQDSDYYYFKADILAGLITYSTDKNIAANLETITAERAKQIIEMNRRGEKPDSLTEDGGQKAAQGPVDLATQENIARFDRSKKKKKKKNRKPQAPRNDQ